jgi:hypothetical protein
MTSWYDKPKIKTEVLTANYPIALPKKAAQKGSETKNYPIMRE